MANNAPAQTYTEHGRDYCAFRRGVYLYPCDEQEKVRMDMMHTILLDARRGELHRAPVQDDKDYRILDLGTGTGIWAIDMAEYAAEQIERPKPQWTKVACSRYRKAEVIGIDLANIQPQMMPENLRFNVGIDYLSPWTLGYDSWNLIHLRQALGSVQNWPSLYHKIFHHLKPGIGCIEQIEIDLEPRCDDGTMPFTPLKQWYEDLKEATRTVGRPIEYNHQTREMLERAGFVEIQEQVYRAPFNTWPKDSQLKAIGSRYCACLLEWIEALSLGPLSTAFGWKATDIQRLLAALSKAILNRKIHAYHNIHIWVARRPEG